LKRIIITFVIDKKSFIAMNNDFQKTLQMERMLKHAKSEITLKRAQELTKTMYQLTYQLPMSKLTKTKILGMDDQQQELYDTVARWINRK
jgi:Lon protease-like protein